MNANVTKFVKRVQTTIVKHSPEILTGIGITGLIGAGIMAVKATPKALNLIEEEKNRQNNELEDVKITELTPVDTIKATWKCYIPAVVTGTLSVACLIGASSVNARRNAALATAYTLSETALREYKDKVIESIGEEQEKKIRDAIAKERIEKNPVKDSEVILSDSDDLCYDVITGRYFRSDCDSIKQIENELNRRLMSEMYISLNEFYYEVGLDCVKMGHDLGWNIDDGLINLDFSSQLSKDGKPCLVVDYRIAPRYDFRKLL